MTCPKHGSQIEEQRIALVLNGGISLAVWMSGVVNEISSLTRLSHDEELTRNPHSAAVWKSILEKTPRRCLRVDLIAGTSAGGLNGAFLAHAIANQRELFDMRNIWVQQAKLDTSHLLNPEPAQAAWALNGEFFGRAIRDQMQGSLDTPRSSGPPPTITLLTTATAINDDPIPSRDDVEAEYSYRDSRRVYAFRQRGWRPGDTELTDEATLALAARASASYPVAFQPVSETAELGARRIQGRGDSGLLMDGGVLDNAPFEPLLAELRSMPINGRRKRHLLYVTPDLGKLESAASVAVDWLSELRQVWSIMREGDTRLDEDALRQARDDSSYEASIPHKVLIKWLDNPGTEIDIDPNLFQQYRAGRFEAFYRWLEPEPGSSYDVPDGLIPAEPVTAADRPGFELDAGGANWSWGLSVAQRISNWLGRAAAERPYTEESGEALAQAFEAVQALQQNVADRFESFTSAVDCERRWRAVADFYGNVELRAELGGLLRAAADAVGAVYGSERVLEFALRLEVLTNTWSWAMPDGRDAPRFEYRRITPAEDPPFPDPFFEDTGWQAGKLYGQQWAAFGAFATAEAREHDWLWGRLDGAMALVEVLYAGSDWDRRRVG